jgi:hypothetical protein
MAAISTAYAGCALYVSFRIWNSMETGEITFGRQGDWLFHRDAQPFWFWFASAWHLFAVALLVVCMIFHGRQVNKGL